MDNFMHCLVIGLLIHMGFMASREKYVCRPYNPTEQCEDGRYEVKFYSVAWSNKDRRLESYFAGIAEARCIARKGNRFYTEDMKLSAHLTGVWHQPEFYETQELTTKYTEVCRVE
jgi:hypothetical protein